MNRLSRYFITAAYNNAWANHRLFGAVSRLTPAEFAARRTSFFPSLKATLNHQVTVDGYYVDALERGVAGREINREGPRFFDPQEPFDACAPLREAQRDVDRRLIVLCRGLDDEGLDREVGIQRSSALHFETVSRLLAHLFQHQVHHRGQAHAMLAGTNVAPPQLDEFFCANDEPLRRAYMRELGDSEAMIWGDDKPPAP